MLLYTEFQRERPAEPKSTYREARRRITRPHEPYYLPGSIETFLGGEMNMAQYTEGERNIRHYLEYGVYPAPPRRYRKQTMGEIETPAEWKPQYTEDERNIRHYLEYGTKPAPPRRYRKQQYFGENTQPPTFLADGTVGSPKNTPSWGIIGGLLLAGLILWKVF